MHNPINLERLDGVYAKSEERWSHNSSISCATCFSANNFAIKDGSPRVPRI